MAIKVFYSDQAGAPVLNGTIGSLIDVLDACLVTGYSEVQIATLIRVGSTVTCETVAPHGFTGPRDNYWSVDGAGNIATIAGADQLEYNGEWPVTVIDESSFSFNIGTATPASPATGLELVCRRSPAGFSKAFSAPNKAAYRSNDPTSRKFYLQVNDTGDSVTGQGGQFAWWRGYEKMTSVDDGEFPFPAITQSGIQGQRLRKSNALNVDGRRWTVISDGKSFLLQTHVDIGRLSIGVSQYAGMCFFGDFMPIAPDPYAVFIDGDSSTAVAPTSYSYAGLLQASGQDTRYPFSGAGWACIARRYNGQPTPVWAAGKVASGFGSPQCFGMNAYAQYPDPFSNRLHLIQVKLFDSNIFRGTLPFYESLAGIVHSDREIVKNVAGKEGRVFMYLRGSTFAPNYLGGIYIDITGEDNGSWS